MPVKLKLENPLYHSIDFGTVKARNATGQAGKLLKVKATEDLLEYLAQGSGGGLDSDLLDGKHAPTGAIVGTSDAQTLTSKILSLVKIKDEDPTPVGDVLLKVLDGSLEFRDQADANKAKCLADAFFVGVSGSGAHIGGLAFGEGGIAVGYNARWDGSQWVRIDTDWASQILHGSQQMKFRFAGYGSGGTPLSWNEKFILQSSGGKLSLTHFGLEADSTTEGGYAGLTMPGVASGGLAIAPTWHANAYWKPSTSQWINGGGNPTAIQLREGLIEFFFSPYGAGGSAVAWDKLFWFNQAGRFFCSAPTSAPTDTDLSNGMFTTWLDETAGKLKFRIKKSDGTLVTAELAYA